MRERGVAVDVAVALSSTGRSGLSRAESGADSLGNLSVLSAHNTRSGGYVTAARLDAARELLSERDWAIVGDVARLRLVTGQQLERLHFSDLTDASRPVVRRRVLGRLVGARVLATLERRIGGVRAGSQGLVFHLDVAGRRLLDSGRRGGPPGARFVRHVLAVTELYVGLTEAARAGLLRLDDFQAEPASWWPDGHGSVIKPDAYATVGTEDHTDHWWIEVDLATEHAPTLARKLKTYVDFWQGGQVGPDGIMPRVLVTVPDAKRYSQVVRLIRQMPMQEGGLFTVALHNDTAHSIVRMLGQS